MAATNSSLLKRRIETVLATKAIQKQRQPFDGEPPLLSPVPDRIVLGTSITGSTYELEQNALSQHLLAVGQSGAGKTTLFYNLMDHLSVPFWAFDLKQDYRHLLQHDDDLLVLPWTEFKFNPLKPPPGVAPRRWAQVFSEMFGHALEHLLNRNVVFEFDGLGRDLQNFLMEILFAAVYEYRVAQNQRGGNLRHVFILDEGKQVFSVYKERQDAAGIPAIDALTAKMREFGEGLVVGDQEATKLTDSIKANTATKILLATGDAKQFDDIAATMQLTERQQTVAQTLGTGDAIIQTGRHDPCPVRLDNYELEKTISDAELRQRQKEEWDALSWAARETRSAVTEQATQSDEETGADRSEGPSGQEITLSDGGDRLLTDIIQQPFQRVTDRYDRFSSVYKGDQAKQELLEKDLVEEQAVTTGTGTRTLFDLTPEGREYAESSLEVETKHRGRGDVAHQYWQHRIKDLFEETGRPAKRELFDVDVYVYMDGTELVVEVAMGVNDREIAHVEKHLEKGFDRVWVLCPSEDVRDGLEQRLSEEDLLDDRVDLRLLRELRDAEQPPL